MSQSTSKRLRSSSTGDKDNDIIPEKKPNIFSDKCNTYQASGIKRSLHGTIYQLKLLMLFVVRGVRNNYKFRLATEIDAAGKFDDLVFQYQSANAIANRFLQAKHKQDESKLISFSDLTNEENDDFSLQKYFISYQLIKGNCSQFGGDLKDFILCTNIDLDYEDMDRNSVIVKKISEKDDFFMSCGASTKCKFGVEVQNELYERLRECSRLHSLANALFLHIKESKSLTLGTEDFKLYHRALVNEKVVDIKNEGFHDTFINSDQSLSESARKLRDILENRFSKIGGLKISDTKLKFSAPFGVGFELIPNPQIDPVKDFAIHIAELIKKSIKDGTNVVKVEKRKNLVKDNINKLAGHVIVERGSQNVFSTNFLDPNSKLCGNLDDFRALLKKSLEEKNYQFTTLNQLTLSVANFQTCEDGKHNELPPPLPFDKIKDEEIAEFFDKLVFAVNQPNELELTKIIEKEMGEYSDFNLLDASLIADSFEIQMLDWFKMKHGEWISDENAQKFFKSLQQKMMALILVGCNTYIERLRAFQMTYERQNEILKQFLIEDNCDSCLSVLNFISTYHTLLGSIKVFQAVSSVPTFKKLDGYIFICLTTLSLPETRKRVVTAFRSRASIKLLIIECNTENCDEIDRLRDDILNVKGKLILISKHSLSMKFPNEIHVCNDSTGFKDLSAQSQIKILDKLILFQGNELQLKTVLPDNVSTVDSIIDSNTLVKLMKNHHISIGKELQIINDYNERSYIKRTFYSLIGGLKKISNDSFARDQVEYEYSKSSLPLETISTRWNYYTKETVLSDEEFVERQYRIAPSNLILLSDDSGTGKSTILYRLYELIKALLPNHLTFLIRLNNCTKILKTELTTMPRNADKRWAIDLLLKMLECNLSKTHFEENYIRASLNDANRTTLLLDGVDEVCPDFRSLIVGLVRELRATKIAKIWMTTRTIMKDNLEKEFLVTAVSLQPFSLQDQIRFLQQNFSDATNTDFVQSYAEIYAEVLIEKFASSIKDDIKKFTGSPLQLKMLASVFKPKFSEELKRHREADGVTLTPTFPIKFKLNQLYEDFIAEKRRIYSEDKSTQLVGNVASNNEREFYLRSILNYHEELAFEELFSDEKIAELHFHRDDDEIFQSIEKIGIVQKINENFYFVHFTFAEYLVAKYLARKLVETRKPDKNALKFLFEEILLQKHNEGVRTFFDGFLSETSKLEGILKSCGDIFSKLLRGTDHYFTNSPLHLACLEKNASIIRFMVNSLIAGDGNAELLKSLVEAKNHNGETVLYKAAELGDLDLILFLKSVAGANSDANDSHDNTVLMKSVIAGHSFDVIKSLGGNVNAVNEDNESVLFKAAEMGNLQVVQYLVTSGANVKFQADNGMTVLHNSIHSGSCEVVQCLVSNGANVDAVDDDGNSILHYAAYAGNLKLCKWLADGAGGGVSNVHIQSKEGSSILHEAAISGNLELCQWLDEELGLDFECKDENDRTALHEACKYNNLAIAEWLVNAKSASIYSVDNSGSTLLIDAAKYGDSNLCQWLNDQGLNANATDRKGRTMLRISIKYGNLDVLQWLTSKKDYNAEMEIQSIRVEDIFCPLLASSANHEMKWMLKRNSKVSEWVAPDGISRTGSLTHRNDPEEIVLHLVSHGANINAQSSSGETTLHCAISKGYIDLARRLLEKKGAEVDCALQDANRKTILDIAKEMEEFRLVNLLEKLKLK